MRQVGQKFAFELLASELGKIDPSSDDATTRRANVLLFLVRSGVLDSLNRVELEKMAIKQVNSRDEIIPITFGSGLPSYSLAIPDKSTGQTESSYRVLVTAVKEINSGVEEVSSFGRLIDYWRAVPQVDFTSASPDFGWSGAFVSWLISQANQPGQLKGSAAVSAIWDEAVRKSMTFIVGEKVVLPGDIAVYSREVGVNGDDWIKRTGFRRGHIGVVYSVSDVGFSAIEGNVMNAIRISSHDMAEASLVGFIRLRD